MKSATTFRLHGCAVLLVAALARPQTAKVVGAPTESEHHRGPDGLEAWTLNYEVPEQDERYPGTLVIARNGRVLRKINGDPFIWKWIFLENGRQIAYETGPLHFSMTCILADMTSGKQLARYDCFQELPSDAPSWVKHLEDSP